MHFTLCVPTAWSVSGYVQTIAVLTATCLQTVKDFAALSWAWWPLFHSGQSSNPGLTHRCGTNSLCICPPCCTPAQITCTPEGCFLLVWCLRMSLELATSAKSSSGLQLYLLSLRLREGTPQASLPWILSKPYDTLRVIFMVMLSQLKNSCRYSSPCFHYCVISTPD